MVSKPFIFRCSRALEENKKGNKHTHFQDHIFIDNKVFITNAWIRNVSWKDIFRFLESSIFMNKIIGNEQKLTMPHSRAFSCLFHSIGRAYYIIQNAVKFYYSRLPNSESLLPETISSSLQN